jgi:hypothetical protein
MRPIGGKRSRNYTRPPSPFRRKSVPSSWSRLVPPTVDLRGEVQSLLAQPADSFPESAPRSAIKTLPPGAKLAVSRLWKRIRATMRRFLPGRAKGALRETLRPLKGHLYLARIRDSVPGIAGAIHHRSRANLHDLAITHDLARAFADD